MTPCEKLGYKVGDVFEYTESDEGAFPWGAKIRLIDDNGSSNPKFEGVGWRAFDGDTWDFAHLDNVKPLEIDTLEYTLSSASHELKQAREHEQKAQQHRKAHDELMEKAKAMPPQGWKLVLDEQPEEDMSDPENWREGDVLECVSKPEAVTYYFTVGNYYKLVCNDGSDMFRYTDDEGDESWADNAAFRFHHRP